MDEPRTYIPIEIILARPSAFETLTGSEKPQMINPEKYFTKTGYKYKQFIPFNRNQRNAHSKPF